MGKTPHRSGVAATVRNRIQAGRDRFWTHADFNDLPPTATAQALSRLAQAGELRRVRKGMYYRPRPTAFGMSVPTMADPKAWGAFRAAVHPAGLTASNILGLTTQNAPRGEYAISRQNAPSWMSPAKVFTGRPDGRTKLTSHEAAVLEVLRGRARDADPGTDAAGKLLRVLRRPGAFTRVAHAALQEPPRVRAMVGALGQLMHAPSRDLAMLRASLSPLTTFDFGRLSTLPHAEDWQARAPI